MTGIRMSIAIIFWLIGAYGVLIYGDALSGLLVAGIGAAVWPWRGKRKEIEK